MAEYTIEDQIKRLIERLQVPELFERAVQLLGSSTSAPEGPLPWEIVGGPPQAGRPELGALLAGQTAMAPHFPAGTSPSGIALPAQAVMVGAGGAQASPPDLTPLLQEVLLGAIVGNTAGGPSVDGPPPAVRPPVVAIAGAPAPGMPAAPAPAPSGTVAPATGVVDVPIRDIPPLPAFPPQRAASSGPDKGGQTRKPPPREKEEKGGFDDLAVALSALQALAPAEPTLPAPTVGSGGTGMQGTLFPATLPVAAEAPAGLIAYLRNIGALS
jgi:hypothetical protein